MVCGWGCFSLSLSPCSLKRLMSQFLWFPFHFSFSFNFFLLHFNCYTLLCNAYTRCRDIAVLFTIYIIWIGWLVTRCKPSTQKLRHHEKEEYSWPGICCVFSPSSHRLTWCEMCLRSRLFSTIIFDTKRYDTRAQKGHERERKKRSERVSWVKGSEHVKSTQY